MARAVLGIDAAWTLGQPSGVALAVEEQDGWRVVAAEHSYDGFHARATDGPRVEGRPLGSRPDAARLLMSARALGGCAVDLIAVDMPLAHSPIVGRRTSDLAVSRAYGGRKCSTHSPSAVRPGPVSDQLKLEFERQGYRLCTTDIATPGVIEVYPHPALVELAGVSERLPYKIGKAAKYWPQATPSERRANVQAQWTVIVRLLESQLRGVASSLPTVTTESRGWALKACEDTLDAIICAWIAICCLERRARCYGDHESAIWIPASLGDSSR